MTLRAVPKPSRMLVSPKLRQSARGRQCSLRWACDGGDVVLALGGGQRVTVLDTTLAALAGDLIV